MELSTKARSDPSWLSRRSVISTRPRCQVVSRVNTAAPISSGNQAPCGILVSVRREEEEVDGEEDAAA